MTIDLQQIARRFAALPPEARRSFAKKLEGSGLDIGTLPIVAAPRDGEAPLSDAQRGLWLTWQREPRSAAYNLGGLLTVRATLDATALDAAFGDLLARHEPLRTSFHLDASGEPVQRILQSVDGTLVVRDLVDCDDAEAESTAHADALVARPFDLETGPLLRLELHRVASDDSRLAIALHHIVADGESIAMIVHELSALYLARVARRPADLPPLPIQFADYVTWQRNRLEAGERERQIAFWTDRLGDNHPPLDLPCDRPRGQSRDMRGGGHAFTLSPTLSARLRQIARRGGASTFTAILALFDLLLARHSGQDDIRIGAPMSNRRRAETLPMIGYFANMAVLRTIVDQRGSFADLLREVREGFLAATDHLDLPFDELVEVLKPPRQAGVHPLFQVKCTEQKASAGEAMFGGFAMTARSLDVGQAHFDLSLDVTDEGDHIGCFFAYARALFEPETVVRLAEDFVDLAEAVTADPTRRLADIVLHRASIEERGVSNPPDVVAAWRRTVVARPEAIALAQEGRTVTRAMLDAASDRLAQALAAAGVGAEVRVALQASRSPEWVLGVLAILKAGGVYVPLDPALPVERRAALVADCGARILVSDGSAPDDFGCERIEACFDVASPATRDCPRPTITPGQAAYVVYTSGSTGAPKGVVVTRGGLAAYADAIGDVLALPDGARYAMVSTVAADLGNTMLYAALCGGGALHLFDASCVFDPDRFCAAMAESRIDALKITPSHLQALMAGNAPQDALPARVLVLGGEATSWTLLDRVHALAPDCRVTNHYGPTETTVGAVCQPAETSDRRAGTLPIGAPLASATTQTLDAYLNPSPVAVAGELFIGGASLARGYAGRPGQTAERFVPDPSGVPGSRMYRTGDRVRRRADGALEFLGRVDDQVKIRGYRVEPGEVAAALRALPGVAAAFVAASETNGAMHLVAYVAGAVTLDVAALGRQLAARLPDYMVPSDIVRLDMLPVTANGKIDRRALPVPEPVRPAGDPPRGPTETALAAIWCDLLGLESVGRGESFAALGGDSIRSLKLLARIRKQGLVPGGKKLSLATILNAESLADLARVLAPVPAVGEPDVVFLRRDGQGVPLFCIPGLIVNSTEFAGMVAVLGADRPVYGFVSHVYTEQRWRGYAIEALVEEYAAYIEKAVSGGRCALLGWSSGGDLAFETARRLKGRVAIDFLGLVDVFEQAKAKVAGALSEAERVRAEGLLEAWLGRSRMAEHWRPLLGRMNADERDETLLYVLDREGDLPTDGPDMVSREFELWAEVDKRTRAARHEHRALALPVHVWQAEHSSSRAEVLRDWSALAPVAALERIEGATHLDIIHAPSFHRGVRDALARADAGRIEAAS